MVKLQEIVRYTLKVLTFIILLILFIYFFLKDQVISFAKSRTTNTSRILENSPNIEFPTLTFCLLPATKLSVAKNYGFQNDNEKFYKEIPNSTLHQRLDELTYQLNRDFEIRSYYEKDKMEIGLQNIKEKENKIKFSFDLRPIRTYSHGTCYQLIPQFNVDRAPLRIKLRITLTANNTLGQESIFCSDNSNSTKMQIKM